MILHVTFTDGSNPWVSLPGDRQTIAKQWKRWVKNHPDTAEPVAICGDYECKPSLWYGGYYITSNTGAMIPRQYYQHLGHALSALERLGGDSR